MGKILELEGKRFGRLTVIKRTIKNKHGKWLWKCKCDCGKEVEVIGSDLKKGHTKSCGCYNLERIIERNTKHQASGDRLFTIWWDMKQRTSNKNNKDYKNYGSRGITVCEEWKEDFKKFQQWAYNNGYEEKLTIGRIDNNEGYYPSNCRWETRKEQARNTRRNKKITYKGNEKTEVEWSEEIGINARTLNDRINKGWNAIEALETPTRRKEKSNE